MDNVAIFDKPPRVALSSDMLVALTPEQEDKWDQTRVAMLWTCPAFSHILYSMLDTMGGKFIAQFTTSIPTAATDGAGLLFNPEWYFKMPVRQRVFVLAHEILHCVFNHCILGWNLSEKKIISFPDGTKLPYDHQTMNVAMDLVINYILVEGHVGDMPEQGHYNPQLVTGRDSFLDAYKKIYEEGGKGGKGSSKDGFDQHLQPGSTSGQSAPQAAAGRNDGKWKVEVATGSALAKSRGKLPLGLEQALKSILDPKVDWREHLQALAARRLGSGSYDWRRPDRRLIVHDMIAPSRSAFSSECLVVACDSSGSVFSEMDMWLAELSGILQEMRPRKLYVVWCDARVQRVDECDGPEDLLTVQRKGAKGGGGTSFVPVFKWVEEQGLQPDGLLYLTDLDGTFPKKVPNYPVIWGCINENKNAPFGDVVRVPKQARRK